MTRSWAILLCLLSMPAILTAQGHDSRAVTAQGPAPHVVSSPTKTNADYSKEPIVIERYATTVRFENDGAGEQNLSVRVRVQSDAGARQLHQLVFQFNSDRQRMEVVYVRTRKKDGTVVNAAADAVKDVTAPVALDAPAYAACKEKRITTPELAAGDTLEYEIATRLTTPFAPGEFWFAHDFLRGAIVLDERLEISVPGTRKVTLRSVALAPYETEQANGRTIYRWKHSNPKISSEDPTKDEVVRAKTKQVDVELTTFANWQDVARSYAKLVRDRSEPTPEISAKTDELVRGQLQVLSKAQALYDYVSTGIRSVDLPLGQGSWTPHSAAEVFANKYGDSADKHILLEALLKAAGIPADAILIPYTRRLDVSAPSPGQLDHVITAVPLGSKLIWMDSTTEVAPFQMLVSLLREKSALLVPADGNGRIVVTPADPPFASTQDVDIDGRVSDLGKLTAKAHYALRGDTELALRLAFHKTPQAQWADLGKTILSLDGIRGDVTDVKPSDPMATHDPFTLDIQFTLSGFLDWSSKRATTPLPLLAIGLPDPPKDVAKPIELGSPLRVHVKLHLILPLVYAVQPPVSASITRDYADFKSSYGFTDHAISAERSLDFKMRTIPASRADDYRDFATAIAADQNRALTVINSASGEPAVPASATADELVEAGLSTLNAGNTRSAIPLFERAVQLDPHHKQAWIDLGLAYLRVNKNEEAASAFQKQLETNPADLHANDYLGLVLERLDKKAEAIAAFRKQTELDPLDPTARAALGELFLDQHDYVQAASELDKATILTPDNAALRVSLGRAYLKTNEKEKALAAFDKAAALSPTPLIWNDIAYNLADNKIELDRAQKDAESAVAAIAADLHSVDLAHVKGAQLNEVVTLSACWDTLGWVYFAKGDLQTADRYIHAAWMLDQNGEIGDHLAQIYEKLGQKERAIHTFALALAAPDSVSETRARLTLLLGGNSEIDDLVEKARPNFAALHSFLLKGLWKDDVAADFLLLFSPVRAGGLSANVEAIRFAYGSEELRPFAEELRDLPYSMEFPDASSAKLVRRGTLSCSAKTGDCIFNLIRPEDSRATN